MMQNIFVESLSAFGQRLSFDSAWSTGWLLGNLLWHGRPQQREETVQRVALHLAKTPHEAASIARQSYISTSRSLLELFQNRRLDERFFAERLTFANPELFDSVLRSGRALVVTTARLGAWELMFGLLGRLCPGRRVQVVVRKQRNAALAAMSERLRERSGVELVPQAAAAHLVAPCLEGGGVSTWFVDHDCNRGEAVFLPFLGRIAAVPMEPALAAIQAHALVWPVFLLRRERGRYELVTSKPLDTATLQGDTRDRLDETARFYTRSVGEQVRQHPGEWFWMHDRWQTQPRPLTVPE
jgi:Kdo2-lipid IVA lauroyltransferase/acyltransferase